jgi:hypothetical protein
MVVPCGGSRTLAQTPGGSNAGTRRRRRRCRQPASALASSTLCRIGSGFAGGVSDDSRATPSRATPTTRVKSALGFADTARFSRALLDAVEHVASTSVGDDCGVGFVEPSPWATAFAALDRVHESASARR